LGRDIFLGRMIEPPLALTGYEFSLFLHITAVMVGFGATFAEAIMFPVAVKAGVRYLPYVHRLQLAINQLLAAPALAIVLATGIYQVADGNWEFDQFWISAALVIVIAIGGLLGGYFIPTDRRLAPMVEAEIAAAGPDVTLAQLSDEYQRRARMEGVIGTVTGILLVAAVYLMVAKPGA
jgi:uncharacterized membrane protein